MKKIIVGVACIMCMVCGFILYSPQALAIPSGDVGDDYYKLERQMINENSSDIIYNGCVGKDTSPTRCSYEIEVRPVSGNGEIMSLFIPVVKGYATEERHRDYFTWYIEELPYPGTKYYYIIRERIYSTNIYLRIVKTGIFTTTGTQPEWLANYSSGSSGGSSLDYSTVFAEIRDKLNNIATNLGSIDREAPTISLFWEGNRTMTDNTHTAKLFIIASDDLSPFTNLTIEYKVEAGTYTTLTGGVDNVDITFSDENSGEFKNVIVRVTDEVGKQTTTYKTIYVQ